MTKEQAFFLSIIKDHIRKEKTEIPGDVDWSIISRYAKEQDLQGIVYYQCKSYLKSFFQLKEVCKTLDKAFMLSLYMYASYNHSYSEVKAAFQESNIRFFTVKGLEVALTYPFPALRTMGDLDIVMSTEDREKSISTMKQMGYSLQKGAYEWHYRKQNVNIEAHNCLNYYEYQDYRTPFFKSCWEYCENSKDGTTILNHSYHFVFLIEHLRRHFNTHGVGFRQFIDIVTYIETYRDLDWNWIEETLTKLGILLFAKNVFYVCEQWWGFSPPKKMQGILHDQDFLDESTDLIFRNGVFGFNNDEHWGNALSGSLSHMETIAILRPVIRCFREVCKPYEVMSRYPYCSFLIGKKYLLPLAWGRRFFYLTNNKRKETIKAVKSMTDKEKLSKHIDIRKQWGL